MIKHYFLLQCIFPCLIAYSSAAHAAPITWVAQSPNNDMNDSANWNPNSIPGSSDEAVFDSTLFGIDTNPTENSSPFSVSTFNFPNNASGFNFNFNNNTLTFNGTGITGSNTNPSITVTNTNNSSFPGDLISFLGETGTSAASLITSSNSGTLTGNQSGAVTSINSNLHSTGEFTITSGGNIIAHNTGNDDTHGTGNNGTANTGSGQLRFDQSFTAENNIAVSVSNSGTFSGTNTDHGDAVAIVNGSQFISSGAFQVGDNFNCELQNTGNDSSIGVGFSNIGQLNYAQMLLQTTGTVGDNCTITLFNTGITSQTTNFPDSVGFLNDQQFFVGNTFLAGNNFSLTTSNAGTDTSNGYGGNQIAIINSNSGTSGNQILFQQGLTLGDHATISAANSGTYSGTNTNGGSSVAGMNLQQIAIGDSTSPGSYSFTAGDYFSLMAANSGIDSSIGTGADAVGDVSSDQIVIFTPVVLSDSANITITNCGNFSGDASTTYLTIGSVEGCQLNCESSFSAGANFTLNVNNFGINTGSGIGNYYIGDLTGGQQVTFQNSLIVGNNASITISNSGTSSSHTTSNNQVGSLMGYGKQLLAKNQFQIGDDFLLEITNSGFDDSTGAGGNYVGVMHNNTVDYSASQLHLADGGSVGERASITLSNSGTYQGLNTASGNLVGFLSGQQLYSVHDFQAGNNFELTLSNSGVDNASGQSYNNIGVVSDSQVEFGDDCMLGNNGSILLTNSGTNNDTTGTLNNIGVVGGSQMLVDGNFTAGTNLNISAINMIINEGNPNNSVGFVNGSQIFFAQDCTLNDGSIINAFNSGTLENSQIVFGQGFDIASGKATIQAVNQGTIGSFGIDILGNNAGGNANIVLGNSSLNIETNLSTFTIAGLVGDSTSIVQSQPQLIINTDALTQAEFSGAIQNFPAASSTLMKTGVGTQKLSGVNTYTGLTTVQEGILSVNGSLAGDVLTASLGILKGNGTIAGTLTNTGVISPGESIGKLTVGNFTNNNGTYAVEVNGLGQSDLIDASGTATLNGGTVVVGSSDGTFRFQQPYTIVTAEGGVRGAFNSATSLAFIKPTLTSDSENVYLTLHSALLNAAERCNQFGVATSLDSIVNPNAAQSLLIGALANLPLEAAQEGLESLSGFQYTNDVLVTNISTSRFLRRLYDPQRSLVTRYKPCSPCNVSCNSWTTWLETGYGYTNLHGNKAKKLNFDSYQLTSGVQKTFCEDFTFGLAGSYEYDHIKYRDGRANRNSAFASIYGLYRPKVLYGLFDIVYGYASNRLKRTVNVGNLHYKASSKPNFNTFTFYGEAGFDLDSNCVLIQPFLGIQIGKNGRGRVNENHASGWGLTINKHDWSTTSSRLGIHLSTCNLYDCIDAFADIAWNQLWSSSRNATAGRFKEFGNAFAICGTQLDNYSFDYAFTLTTCFCESLNGYLEVDGEWWQHATTFNFLGGIEYSW
jgi:autotransporter-associated beta strand protein